jgi:hypothetical protein
VKLSKWPGILSWIVLILILGVGAWARWSYIQAQAFHVDEFISMLAVRMILEKGTPVLPSGLYYDHGLVFSYIGAAVAWLTGGDLLAVRWWSLMVSLLVIICAYVLSWQLFGARWWGLVAAVAMAWFPDAIEWGGRVRMYSQANLILLVWILLAWWGIMKGGHRWARWSLIPALWLGLNTHFVLILVVPPLALALLIIWLVAGDKRIILSDAPWRIATEVGVTVAVLALSVWMARGSFIARYAVESSAAAPNSVVADDDLANRVLDIALDGARWAQMGRYLSKDTLLPLSAIALWGTLIAVVQVVRRQAREAELAALFVALLLIGILVEILVFLSDEWRTTRYNFLLVFPLIPLVTVYGLRVIANSVTAAVRRTRWVQPFAVVAVVGLGFAWPIFSFWPEVMSVTTGDTRDSNRYNLAFEYVDDMREPEDFLLTIRPAAGYLFSHRLDYYANQVSAVVMPSSHGWVDRYIGVPYLAEVEDLNRVLDVPGDLWFVVDTKRLFERFEPAFTQQVLQRMAIVRSFGNVLVLREVDDGWPLAETPQRVLTAFLNDNLQLSGYTWGTLSVAPGEISRLTLFWRADERLLAYKVFVHLRDRTGNTVAQADFVPLEKMNREWRSEVIDQAQNEFIRLGTSLAVPPGLPPGKYAVWVGLYDANTLERLPVIDDMSGENAISLGELIISDKPAMDK